MESVRLGEVGGNTLGFQGCQLGPGSGSILGYGFNGSLHLWRKEEGQVWEPGVVVGGHFGPVEDLDWEKEEGR